MCQTSLMALKIFLFCLLNFSNYIVKFSKNGFTILSEVCLVFWISGFTVFNKFGKFSFIFS